jgi:hypothetical protein
VIIDILIDNGGNLLTVNVFHPQIIVGAPIVAVAA